MVALAALISAALFAATPWSIALEERVGLGLLFALRGMREPPPVAAVVAIDAAAAEALAQPRNPAQWPRSLHAQLVDGLKAAGARVIAFDLFFSRPGAEPRADALLAEALARAGNVVLLDLLEPLGTDGETGTNLLERIVQPVPAFRAAAAAHAPFPLPKHDGVRAWWLQRPRGTQTLPLAVFRLHAPSAAVPDATVQARYLDFYGPPGTVPTLGYHEVLAAAAGSEAGNTLRRAVEGRAVFVGYASATAEGQDRIRDSFDTVYTRADGVALSGVEIAATAFANLAEGRWPRPLTLSGQAGVGLGAALLLGLLCATLSPLKAVPAVLAAGAAYLGVAHLRFVADAQWLPLTVPLLVQVPAALFAGALWHGLRERRLRRRYGVVIDELLPRQIAARVAGRSTADAGADEQQVYGVFVMTDVAGFTTLAEAMAPAAVTRRLNAYFALMFPVIERHGGSVSEINGDAMLAFWLASGPGEASVRRAACLAALEIERAMADGNAPAGLPTRIGVHAGLVTLARLGASGHHEYRVVGDAANTASRLESLSKQLGTRLLASEEAVDGLGDLLTRPLGTYVLVGRSSPVRVHEIVDTRATATEEQRARCALFARGLAAFHARRWHDAGAAWEALVSRWPEDGPSRYFLALARDHAAAEPAPAWDGTIHLIAK